MNPINLSSPTCSEPIIKKSLKKRPTTKKTNEKQRPTTKKTNEKQRPMIRCKTFVFKPSGNGVINFAYKLMFDEEIVREAGEAFAKDQQDESIVKGNDGEGDGREEMIKPGSEMTVVVPVMKNNQISECSFDDSVMKSPSISAINLENPGPATATVTNSPIASETVTDVTTTTSVVTHIAASTVTTVAHRNNSTAVSIPLTTERSSAATDSVPKVLTETKDDDGGKVTNICRRSRLKPVSDLATIKEESEEDLAKCEEERILFEEFYEGIMSPSEKNDYWETSPLSMEEIKNLGVKKEMIGGIKIVTVTPEARQRMIESPEYKEHMRMKKAAGFDGKRRKSNVIAVPVGNGDIRYIEIGDTKSIDLDNFTRIELVKDGGNQEIAMNAIAPVKPAPKDHGKEKRTITNYTSSAGVLEVSAKERERLERTKEKEPLYQIGGVEKEEREERRSSARLIDLSSFKRIRRV